MTTEAELDMTWSALSDEEPAARISGMRQRFDAMAGLDQATREQQAEAMIRAEYALGDEQLADFTESRLRSWLSLAADNLPEAQDVANAFATSCASGRLSAARLSHERRRLSVKSASCSSPSAYSARIIASACCSRVAWSRPAMASKRCRIPEIRAAGSSSLSADHVMSSSASVVIALPLSRLAQVKRCTLAQALPAR